MITMEINKLKTFVELASTLSFSETAANLFINQSSVSKQIKSLERELNCELFIRSKRQVRMTEYDKIIIGVLPIFWNYSFFDQISSFKR